MPSGLIQVGVVSLLMVVGLIVGVIWIGRVLRNRVIPLSGKLGIDPGPALRTSGLGTAKINGLVCQGRARLREHEDGYVLAERTLRGSYEVYWLPREAVEAAEFKREGLLRQRSVQLKSEEGRNIKVYGHLAVFLKKAK
ncbi:MAG: hypothetical protein AAF750_15920 [Planctomycetota bacterium]